jgi:two-component system sensor histidine kinase UhpB
MSGPAAASAMSALPHASVPASEDPRSRAVPDLLRVAAVTVAFFLFAVKVELSEHLAAWTLRHERLQLDEFPMTLVVLCACLAWFGWRRLQERARAMEARMQLVAALRIAVRQNRDLARQLLRLQEAERSRFARELHDEIAQQCVAIRVEAAGIEDEARGRELSTVANGARLIRETIDHLQGVVRDMLTRLRPPMLDALGLEVSLHVLAARWSQRHGIACGVQVDPCCERLGDEARVALYRVAQEALTNVARHAGASHVQLRLSQEQEGRVMLLTLDDDGRGMADSEGHGGLGLVGMAERVAILGGSFAVAPSPGGGVRVEVRVPVLQVDAREEVPA